MKNKALKIFLLALLVVFFQFLLQNLFGAWAGKFNLVLVLSVVLINFLTLDDLVLFVVASGLLLDVYSVTPFGLITFCLLISLIATYFLFMNFFTNLSLYSLMFLGLFMSFIFHFLLWSLLAGGYFFGLIEISYWRSDWLLILFWQGISNQLLIFILYFLINRWSKNFKPIFLK